MKVKEIRELLVLLDNKTGEIEIEQWSMPYGIFVKIADVIKNDGKDQTVLDIIQIDMAKYNIKNVGRV